MNLETGCQIRNQYVTLRVERLTGVCNDLIYAIGAVNMATDFKRSLQSCGPLRQSASAFSPVILGSSMACDAM